MPNPNYDYLQQHPLQSIINIQWGGLRFICVDLDLDRRPTIQWIKDGPTEVEKARRGAQTNDYVDLRIADPGFAGDWPFELLGFRYCSTYHPTLFDVEFTETSFVIADVFDDFDTHPAPVSFSVGNGAMFGSNPLHTNWTAPETASNPIEITGLPDFPVEISRTGFAAAFENATIFIEGPKFFAPQIEWEEVEGELIQPPRGSEATAISQPNSLEGAPTESLVHFKRATEVRFKMRGIASDGNGNTEVGVGFVPEGGPVSGSAPPIETGYPSTFDETVINFASLRIDWDGTGWRAIGAAHEPSPVDIPSIPDRPGKMWLLFVRNNDPDY